MNKVWYILAMLAFIQSCAVYVLVAILGGYTNRSCCQSRNAYPLPMTFHMSIKGMVLFEAVKIKWDL